LLWLLLFYSVDFTKEEGYELRVFNKYDFQTLRLLKIKHIIIMVMAATTTTNSQGKRLATKSPAAKENTQPAVFCFIDLTPILHNTRQNKKCYRKLKVYIDIFEQVFYNTLIRTFVCFEAYMRYILHSDCNGFFASVECLHNPEIRNKPVAVCGDTDMRHGIILAKNEIAKQYNIKTGEAIWQAVEKCPELVTVKPHFDRYIRFSKEATRIYSDYSDRIEPFGIDESWIDLTGCVNSFEEAQAVAEQIRKRVKYELGITVSIGVSFNKIFAKLGSDYKKPDAVTLITDKNYKDIVWKLPVEDLLNVGRSTKTKLNSIGVFTIGQLANFPYPILKSNFGKWADILHTFSNGLDMSPVKALGFVNLPKSIGNSTTTCRDMKNYEDAKIVMNVLADSVCRRMRDQALSATTVTVSLRDTTLMTITRQCKIETTDISCEVLSAALKLIKENYRFDKPLRSIGISLSDFKPKLEPQQLSLLRDEKKRTRQSALDSSIDILKKRFGSYCVRPAVLLADRGLSGFSPKEEHTVHPVGYFS